MCICKEKLLRERYTINGKYGKYGEKKLKKPKNKLSAGNFFHFFYFKFGNKGYFFLLRAYTNHCVGLDTSLVLVQFSKGEVNTYK